MTITAKIIADSVNLLGERITTMQLRYPRFIHSEFMTHRVFSRNASSSRAIPVARQIEDILSDTAMPIHWGKNQPGMQAREEHDTEVEMFRPFHETSSSAGFPGWNEIEDLSTQNLTMVKEAGTAEEAWRNARDFAIATAQAFNKAGYHKQVVNRLLEPFSHINVIVTATAWDNFFALRLHPDAQPEIHELAKVMFGAMDSSEPTVASAHLPYLSGQERIGRTLQEQCQISAARCARVSYMTHDGRPSDPEKDIQLAASLWNDGHWSPFEHQAFPTPGETHANFDGWGSARSIAAEVE
jgi:thymidylate synthase ThyX